MGSEDKALDKLYDELKFIQERRSRIGIAKLTFVSLFFGIGSFKLDNDVSRTALFLVPLVAVIFDMHAIASTISIYRLESFLGQGARRLRDWHKFKNGYKFPDRTNMAIHYILTGAAFVVPAYLIWRCEIRHFVPELWNDWWRIPLILVLVLAPASCIIKRINEELKKERSVACLLSWWYRANLVLSLVFLIGLVFLAADALYQVHPFGDKWLIPFVFVFPILSGGYLVLSFFVGASSERKSYLAHMLCCCRVLWGISLLATACFLVAVMLWLEWKAVAFILPLLLAVSFRYLEATAREQLDPKPTDDGNKLSTQQEKCSPCCTKEE